MNPGALRHRITLERPVASQSDSGAESVAFVPLVPAVPASVEPLHGREALQAGQITAEQDTRIVIRWSPDVAALNAKWRIRHDGVIYNIGQVSHVKLERKEIEILCSSGVNQS